MTLQRTFAEGDPAVTNAICVSCLENFLLVAETPEQLKLEAEQRWSPDRSYREARELPAVRAPHEGRFCLKRLAILTALG